MAATPLVTLNDVLENVKFQAEINPLLASFIVAVQAYQLLYVAELAYELTEDDINQVLKKYTGCVKSTGTELNCYPVGYDASQCFDLSGEPVP